MGNKWADYGISEVKYNSEQTHIVKASVREDKGNSLGASEEWTRNQIVSAIEHGKTFVTILKNNDGKWRKGQDVHVIMVNGIKYIRTDQNRTASDNLENLPQV